MSTAIAIQDAWPLSEPRHVTDTLFVTLKHPGRVPLVAVALHHGCRLRPEVKQRLLLDKDERRREEDPYSAQWTGVAPTALIALRSRFEVDLNRPRERAVYRGPEDAWGLSLWRDELPEDLVERSLATHDAFYVAIGDILDGLVRRHGRFLVLDMHSYNHRRAGPNGLPDDPATSPDMNFGTLSLTSPGWRPFVERLVDVAARSDICGRPLTVGENVRFGGGYFPTWVNERYGTFGAAIAIEVKKFYMDEWTGRAHPRELRACTAVMARLAEGMADVFEES
jgi:N-formylglutamate amidohydrolase